MSRQAYYKHLQRTELKEEGQFRLLYQVREIRKTHPRIGARKLHELLVNHPDRIGRDRFMRLLREHGLLIRRKRNPVRTTNSNHYYKRYSNLVKGLYIDRPMQVWVSDITYVNLGGKHAYLSLITDAFSRKIVGAKLASTLASKHTLEVLRQAIANEGTPEYHHSDRGIQYCCHDYVNELKSYNVKISMTQSGDPLDNAIAERVNGIIKNEYMYPYLKRGTETNEVLTLALRAYNEQRPHMSCGMKTPKRAHEVSPYNRTNSDVLTSARS